MKTMTKKLGAVVLALAMCFSLCCVAFAADGDDPEPQQYTITVDPAYSGETYTAYKVFDATYDGDAISYSISSDSPWYEQVKASTVFTLTEITAASTEGVTVYQVTLVEGATATQIVEVLKTIPEGAAAAATGTAGEVINPDGSTGTTTVTLDVTSSGAGYYYVTTTLGSAVAINSAAPSVTVEDKNEPPTVEKTVNDQEEDSVENHKSVEYEFDISDVKGIKCLVLEDQMEADEKISYEFDWDTLTVTLVENAGATRTTLNLGTDYTLVKAPADGCDFHVDFTIYDFDDCKDDAHIVVTISCELDAGEYGFEEDEVKIPNHALVSYGNGGKSVWKEADVYEYGFEVYKVDGTSRSALAGAHFILTNTDERQGNIDYGNTAYFSNAEGSNVYVLEGWVGASEAAPDGYTTDLVTDSSGYIKIEGLDGGGYTITETQAPEGYNLLTEPITITIIPDDNDPSRFTVNDSFNHVVTVENNAGTALPSTGGIGTTIFYIIGGVLVVGAVVVLVTRRRMTREG